MIGEIEGVEGGGSKAYCLPWACDRRQSWLQVVIDQVKSA